jgi:hypothetical protein
MMDVLDESALGEDNNFKKWDLICELAWQIELGWWCIRSEFWRVPDRERVYDGVLEIASVARPVIPFSVVPPPPQRVCEPLPKHLGVHRYSPVRVHRYSL